MGRFASGKAHALRELIPKILVGVMLLYAIQPWLTVNLAWRIAPNRSAHRPAIALTMRLESNSGATLLQYALYTGRDT